MLESALRLMRNALGLEAPANPDSAGEDSALDASSAPDLAPAETKVAAETMVAAETKDTQYPARCLRGIKTKSWLHPDNRLKSDAFPWNIKTVEKRRADGKAPGLEVSINWDDDDGAEAQTRADSNNAAAGVAAIPFSVLEYVSQLPASPSGMFWERAPLTTNRYHGNLVCHESTPKPCQHMAAQMLALHAEVLPGPIEPDIGGDAPAKGED